MCTFRPRARLRPFCAVGLALAIVLAVVAVGLAPAVGSSGASSDGNGWTSPWVRS